MSNVGARGVLGYLAEECRGVLRIVGSPVGVANNLGIARELVHGGMVSAVKLTQQ